MSPATDRTRDLLEQLPIRGYEPDGNDNLSLTRTLLGNAVSAIEREPDRMGAWRLVGAVLETRKALKSHISLCNSANGPLARLPGSQGESGDAVQRLLGEHPAILAALDDLITVANRDKASSPGSARMLRQAAQDCAATLEDYAARYRELVAGQPRLAGFPAR